MAAWAAGSVQPRTVRTGAAFVASAIEGSSMAVPVSAARIRAEGLSHKIAGLSGETRIARARVGAVGGGNTNAVPTAIVGTSQSFGRARAARKAVVAKASLGGRFVGMWSCARPSSGNTLKLKKLNG